MSNIALIGTNSQAGQLELLVMLAGKVLETTYIGCSSNMVGKAHSRGTWSPRIWIVSRYGILTLISCAGQNGRFLEVLEIWKQRAIAAAVAPDPEVPPAKVFKPKHALPAVSDYKASQPAEFWEKFPSNCSMIGKSTICPICNYNQAVNACLNCHNFKVSPLYKSLLIITMSQQLHVRKTTLQ